MKPAIKELMDDHQTILRMLRALNGMCLRLGEGGGVPADDLGAAVSLVQVTGGGAYAFTGLRPGTYTVAVGGQSGSVGHYSVQLVLNADDGFEGDAGPGVALLPTAQLPQPGR